MYDIESFWTYLKQTSSCRVICFATAEESRLGSDSSTPKVLDRTLRYETVMFSLDEKTKLVTKFRESDLGKKLLTDQVIADIDLLTNRHPGLLYACLSSILNFVNPKSKENFKVFFSYNY